MADAPRARRLAKRIITIVATELEYQVKDPRLAMITITGATVTPDLREATVYYTVYGSDEDQQSTAMALASANGVLRSAVGKQTGIKFTPTLAFKSDTVPVTSKALEELLEAAKAADAEIAHRAATATYAGEADPYKAPREVLDEDLADEDLDEDLDEFDDEDGAVSDDHADVPAADADRSGSGRHRLEVDDLEFDDRIIRDAASRPDAR